MLTAQPAELPTVLVRELMHQFMIPQAGIRVWGAAAAYATQDFAQPVILDNAHENAALARVWKVGEIDRYMSGFRGRGGWHLSGPASGA